MPATWRSVSASSQPIWPTCACMAKSDGICARSRAARRDLFHHLARLCRRCLMNACRSRWPCHCFALRRVALGPGDCCWPRWAREERLVRLVFSCSLCKHFACSLAHKSISWKRRGPQSVRGRVRAPISPPAQWRSDRLGGESLVAPLRPSPSPSPSPSSFR